MKRTDVLSIFAFIAFLCFVTFIISYSAGRASMRSEIKESIMAQDNRVGKVVKVPQLGLSFVPFEKGFLTWADGNPRLASDRRK